LPTPPPPLDQAEELVTTAEVAAVFGKSLVTVSHWVRSGKVRAIRTPGGQYRFRLSEVLADLAGHPPEQDEQQ
jgi:excisionase family DNA binding protein